MVNHNKTKPEPLKVAPELVKKLSSLFDGSRPRTSSVADRNSEDEALSDKGRIVTSKSFRRLQVKAQVFSLEENAAVRSRLTHTLEVATMGEIIARKISRLLGKEFLKASNTFVTTVGNACLLHDIGNPPFGHLGEYAIGNWFELHHGEIAKRWANHGIKQKEILQHLHALANFDGNPQGFRIVTRLSWLNDEFGLNLTNSLLASIVKYLASEKGKGSFYKKVGYFPSESQTVAAIWKKLNLPVNAEGIPNGRHPACYVMEAADDLCYCLSDIDDSLEKGIVNERDFFQAIQKGESSILANIEKKVTSDLKGNLRHAPDAKFSNFKVRATRELGDRLAEIFVNNMGEILDGRLCNSLADSDKEISVAMELLKTYTRQHVFRSREAVTVELGGFQVLKQLLNHYSLIMYSGTKQFDRVLRDAKPNLASQLEHITASSLAANELPLQKRLVTLLPRVHVLNYLHQRKQNEALEPIYRVHLIVDFIAGMTDTHAVKVFNVLEGLSPGEVLR